VTLLFLHYRSWYYYYFVNYWLNNEFHKIFTHLVKFITIVHTVTPIPKCGIIICKEMLSMCYGDKEWQDETCPILQDCQEAVKILANYHPLDRPCLSCALLQCVTRACVTALTAHDAGVKTASPQRHGRQLTSRGMRHLLQWTIITTVIVCLAQLAHNPPHIVCICRPRLLLNQWDITCHVKSYNFKSYPFVLLDAFNITISWPCVVLI